MNWMRALSDHYRAVRARDPEGKLALVFDIDGTILDTRFLVAHVLRAYDREHGTRWFREFKATDVDAHEAHIDALLRDQGLSVAERQKIASWYDAHRLNYAAVREAHRPFRGVLEVIRWFQLQPNTVVALVTGRSESRREETLDLLNALGEQHRVHFSRELLFMRGHDAASVVEMKVTGLRQVQAAGHCVVAVVDNELQNLWAIASADPEQQILLLHADTLFETPRALPERNSPHAPERASVVRGNDYDLTELIREADLADRVQFCWADIESRATLAYFLASDVHWGALCVRREPEHGTLAVGRSERLLDEQRTDALSLDEALTMFRRRGRAAKMILTERGMLGEVLGLVRKHGFGDRDLWFSAAIDIMGESEVAAVAKVHPAARRGVQGNFLAPLCLGLPDEAERLVRRIREWGVNHVTVSWTSHGPHEAIARLASFGLEVDVDDVEDLEALLQVVLLMPKAVTSNFNFPKWSYFGQTGRVPSSIATSAITSALST